MYTVQPTYRRPSLWWAEGASYCICTNDSKLSGWHSILQFPSTQSFDMYVCMLKTMQNVIIYTREGSPEALKKFRPLPCRANHHLPIWLCRYWGCSVQRGGGVWEVPVRDGSRLGITGDKFAQEIPCTEIAHTKAILRERFNKARVCIWGNAGSTWQIRLQTRHPLTLSKHSVVRYLDKLIN